MSFVEYSSYYYHLASLWVFSIAKNLAILHFSLFLYKMADDEYGVSFNLQYNRLQQTSVE